MSCRSNYGLVLWLCIITTESCRLGGRPGNYDYRLGFRAEEVCCVMVLISRCCVCYCRLHGC